MNDDPRIERAVPEPAERRSAVHLVRTYVEGMEAKEAEALAKVRELRRQLDAIEEKTRRGRD